MLPIGAQADEHEMVVCEADGSEVKSAEMCPPTLEERVMTLEQRNSDVVLYGKVHNVLVFNDPAKKADDSTTDVADNASRFGFKVNSDLGNGMSGIGRFEFQVDSDSNGTGTQKTRLGYVGISGGFGTVTIGQQGTAFALEVSGNMDPTNYVGPVKGAAGDFRAPNTIQYSNAVGPLALAVDIRASDSSEAPGRVKDDDGDLVQVGDDNWNGDGAGLGLRVAATDNITLGGAFNTNETPDGVEETYLGASANVSFGNLWGSLGWTSQETESAAGATTGDNEYLAAYFGAQFTDSTRGFIGYSQKEDNHTQNAAEPSKIMAGVYHELGGGVQLWYEGAAKDTDVATEDDDVTHVIGLQINF